MVPSYWSSEDAEDVVSLAEGYNSLESAERIVARRANELYARPIKLWYESLNLYRHAMQGKGEPRKDIDPPVIRLRTQLQAQGLASAKAALDTLMVGYYNVAFAAIRQLMDIYIQCHYLMIRPEDARFWATSPAGGGIVANPPSCRSMITDLKRFAARTGDIQFPSESSWQHLYDRWRSLESWTFAPAVEVDDDVQPDMQVAQMTGFEGGPRHDSGLAMMGFFYGLVTLDSLFTMLAEDGRFDLDGQDSHARYHDELDVWTTSLREDMRTANDEEGEGEEDEPVDG